jgi:hypothetical protein
MVNQVALPPAYVDLSGVLYTQQSILLPNPGDTNSASKDVVSGVSANLQNLYNTFITSDANVQGVLDHQADMESILNTERARINQKKADIDTALVGKERAVILNESHRLRYRHIFKMIFVIIVTLILFIMITFASKAYPFVPSAVFELLSIIVISVGIFSLYFLTISLLKRSPVYFNELNIPGPSASGNALPSSNTKNKNIQDLLGGLNLNSCIGSSCCSEGTTWDAGNVVCLPGNLLAGSTKAAFTTITQSYQIGEITGRANVQPSSPNEFSDYTMIK